MTRKLNVKALGLTTAICSLMAAPAFAQTVTIDEDALAQLTDECRSLAERVQTMETLPEGVTPEQTVETINANDAEACVEFRTTYITDAQDSDQADATAEATARVEINEQALIDGLARVRVPEPEVDVEVPGANVRVMTAQPDVRIEEGQQTIEVEQAQPQISVEIPEIIVRVEIPAPRIFIRSDDPSVQVSSADPQVEIMQDEPRVSVRQGQPEIDVNLNLEAGEETETANATGQTTEEVDGGAAEGGEIRVSRADANVELQQAEGEPNIEFASSEPEVTFANSEPNVTVQMTQQPSVEIASVGEMEVTYETAEEREERRQAAADNANAEEGEAEQMANDGMVTIGDLMAMNVIGADGEDLGSPEAFIDRNDEIHLIVSEGGFLGLGDTEVGIPLSSVRLREGELVLQQMTAAEIEEAGGFEYDPANRLDDDMELRLQ